MKKYLFISNSTKPTYEQNINHDKILLDNVSIPCIEAAISMGYKIYMGVNRFYADELTCDYDIKFYNACIYRSLFDFKNNYKAYKNLMQILKKENFDVIHCNTPVGGVLGRFCGKLAKVPKVIYTAHGFHFYNGAALINNTILKWAEKLMAHFTDTIITINHEDYQAAQKFKLRNNGKVYYVPGVGLNTEEYILKDIDKKKIRELLGLTLDDVVLIAMGDLIKRKNYATSIKVIAKANNPNLHLLICGKGPLLDELITLVKELNIEKQIHFLGFRTDIKELLNVSDIFLFTSYQEGLPRSMMEAMAAGLPCIASKIRGNVDLIKEGIGGYLYSPDDVLSFAEVINNFATNESLRKKIGLNNLEIIKQFDIMNVKIEIEKIYGDVLY